MTQEERSAAIDERREELRQVQKRMRQTEKEFDRLTQRAQHLHVEIDALLKEYNEIVIASAWGAE